MNDSTLRKILVRARRQVFSEVVGTNPSIFKGEGYDFVELREYLYGDDVRHIDWTVTAKMQRPYVKVFREERELNVAVAAMLGGSVHFGQKRFKQELIAEIVALSGYAVLHNGDRLGTFAFADTMVAHARPTRQVSSVRRSVESILNFDALYKSSNYAEMAAQLYRQLRRKSLVIIVADFFELPEFRLLAKKHEVVAIIVRDRLEEQPPPMGLSMLKDPQSGMRLEGDFNTASVRRYAAKVKAHDHALYERFRRDGIRFTKVYTDDSASAALRRLFEGRR